MSKPFIDWFFKDSHGKWAIIQVPNGLLSVWLALVIATYVLRNTHIGADLGLLQSAILFTWAYLELVTGASHFRRLLGGVVLAVVIIGFFR